MAKELTEQQLADMDLELFGVSFIEKTPKGKRRIDPHEFLEGFEIRAVKS